MLPVDYLAVSSETKGKRRKTRGRVKIHVTQTNLPLVKI